MLGKAKELWDRYCTKKEVGSLMYWKEFCEVVKELEDGKNSAPVVGYTSPASSGVQKGGSKKQAIIDKYGLDCPCGNIGHYITQHYDHTELEPEQCEFCYTEPRSKFNLKKDLDEIC